MRVVVLGYPGAGKTALIAQGLSDVRALARDSARMSAADKWRVHRTALRLAGGHPIPATRSPRVATLTLKTAPASDLPPLPVVVHDHPGTAVGTAPTARARRLEADLAQADGIFVAADRPTVSSGGPASHGRARSPSRRGTS